MNINPTAKKVLCYGDSNTWGYTPVTKKRYPVNIRWTGLLQKLLGDEYWVIEEGLNSRTTDLDDPTKAGGEERLSFLWTYSDSKVCVPEGVRACLF